MNCVICHSDNIEEKEVFEEIKNGNDIIYVPITIPVCLSCGERYYDRRVMKMLEDIEEKSGTNTLKLKEIGKVLIYESAV